MRGLVTSMVGVMVLLAAGLGLAKQTVAASAAASATTAPSTAASGAVSTAATTTKTSPASATKAALAAPKKFAGPAVPAGPAKTPKNTGVINLRTLTKPAASLAGKTHDLVPGGTLRFVVKEQVSKGRVTAGLGEVTVPTGVVVKRTVLKAPAANDAAGLTRVEYRISLPVSAKPGLYDVKTNGVASSAKHGATSAKHSSDWSFRFSLRVSPRRPGEPRPL